SRARRRRASARATAASRRPRSGGRRGRAGAGRGASVASECLPERSKIASPAPSAARGRAVIVGIDVGGAAGNRRDGGPPIDLVEPARPAEQLEVVALVNDEVRGAGLLVGLQQGQVPVEAYDLGQLVRRGRGVGELRAQVPEVELALGEYEDPG